MGQEQSGPQNENPDAAPNLVLTIGGRTVQMIKKIAEGGYSFVYLVFDVQTNTKYALKRMIASDITQLRGIEKEISIMQALCTKNHPNFIKFLGSCSRQVNGAKEVYVLMEYCSKGSLVGMIQAYIDAKKPIAEERILKICADVCSGLQAMAALSPPLTHRDLKIENILIGDDGRYKLCDFGSCSTISQVLDDRQQLMLEQCTIDRHSTQTYRAPELCDLHRSRREGWILSTKADIWALGCVLYVLAYTVHPFEDGGVLGILSGKVQFPMVNTLNANGGRTPPYSKYLNYIISKCYTFDPAHRPSASQLYSLIRHWASFLKTKQHPDLALGTEVDTWVPQVIHVKSSSQPSQTPKVSKQNNTNPPPVKHGLVPIPSTANHPRERRVSMEFEVAWSDEEEDNAQKTATVAPSIHPPAKGINNNKTPALKASNAPVSDSDFDALFETAFQDNSEVVAVKLAGPDPTLVKANSRAGRSNLLKAQQNIPKVVQKEDSFGDFEADFGTFVGVSDVQPSVVPRQDNPKGEPFEDLFSTLSIHPNQPTIYSESQKTESTPPTPINLSKKISKSGVFDDMDFAM